MPPNILQKWINRTKSLRALPWNRLNAQRGQSIILVAFLLVGFVAFLGVIFDGGTAYAERRHMQNAADAGALAGVRALVFPPAVCGPGVAKNRDVLNAVRNYAVTRNGADSVSAKFIYLDQTEHDIEDDCENVSDQAYAVHVIATKSFNTFFLKVVGQNNGSVSAEAAFAFGGVNNLKNGVYPIAPQCLNPTGADPTTKCGYLVDHSYDIWNGGGAGNFGWLAWDNTASGSSDQSSKTLCVNIQNPGSMDYTNPNNSADHLLSIGDWVKGSSGISGADCIKSGLDGELTYLIQSHIEITVIFWGNTNGQTGANLQYQIVGFGKFVLEGFNLSGGGGAAYPSGFSCSGVAPSGSDGCIQGRFVEWVDASEVGGFGNPGNQGAIAFRLVAIPPPTPTPGWIPYGTPLHTLTPLPTSTPTNPPTNTPTRTSTPTQTSTNTSTPTRTSTPTNTSTPTSTNTVTPSPSPTPTLPPTNTPTVTPSPTPSAPSIAVTKSGPSTSTQGYVITYVIIVTNNGNDTLNNVTISDPLVGYTSPPGTALGVGQTEPLLLNYTVPIGQVTAFTNTVSVVGYPQSGNPSSVSSSANWATTCVYPAAPSPLVAIKGANIDLSWNAIAGATSYNIYKSTTSSTGPFTLIASPTTTSYSDKVSPGQGTVYYYVTAVNVNMCGGAEGPPSNVVST